MKVLDLDMDFFLSGPCPLAAKGERPVPDACTVWTPGEVRSFLEERCGLSRENPLPGAVFETHDGALDFWQKQIDAGKIRPPFECVHVDTHSDLAFGPPGPDFVLKAVISRKPGVRNTTAAYREGKKLDEANYLLFAAGYRWLSALTYVRNPRSLHDVPERLLDGAGDLVLRSEVSALMEGVNGMEPVIPFTQVDDYRTFKDSGFACATMAQSPRYAPAKADFILDIFREYIKEE